MTTDKKTYPGVILLPWITIKEPVKVGRYSLISTDELEFSSKRLESRFRAFLGRHRNRQGEPVTQAVVMAIDGNGVLDVSEDEINDATSWIPVFFVLANEAAAFRRNLAVAENFDWIFHTLAPVEKGIVLETGSVLKERGYLGPSQKVSFQIPAAANAECIVAADSLIAAALDAAIASDDSVTPNVIRRSAELLLQSFINDQRISSQTRLLLTFFALETILEADDRRAFRELIDEWCGTTGEPTQPCDVRTRRRGRDVWLKLALTEKQIWSNEFYELRNRITHEPVTDRDLEYENGQQHFWIAFDFYRVALNRRLSGHGSFVSLVDVEKNDAGEFELKRTSFRRKQDVDGDCSAGSQGKWRLKLSRTMLKRRPNGRSAPLRLRQAVVEATAGRTEEWTVGKARRPQRGGARRTNRPSYPSRSPRRRLRQQLPRHPSPASPTAAIPIGPMEVGVENAVGAAVGGDVTRVPSMRVNNENRRRESLASEIRRRCALRLGMVTTTGAGGPHHRDQTVVSERSARMKATSAVSITTRGDPGGAICSQTGRATTTAGVASPPTQSIPRRSQRTAQLNRRAGWGLASLARRRVGHPSCC